MYASPLSSILDQIDSNYNNEGEINRKKKMEEKKRNENNDDNEEEKKEKLPPKKSLEDKKMESQFYTITNEETKRSNNMKIKRARVDRMQLIENELELGDNIKHEIQATLKKKSWKSLDMCFKWNLINEYISKLKDSDPDLDITEVDIQNIRNNIVRKETHNVAYNKESQSVESIDYITLAGRKI